ncbi:spore protease YyaC [Desulforamulus aeronauticus]|uniref:Putative sporulation protein YyaC n=1 Tax=Desulforamulus aeronauticus DSM 10349 TaxID=1121421 RepID=A0A1M6T9E9_9FIRM|nr:spore protease YyaC [Desulforamulus aeronauticus]SHK53617.1 putative sporulation protein YyaC [Desulforamulus aeronauticus DSM 10349]
MSVTINTLQQQSMLPPKTRISVEDTLAIDNFSRDLATRLQEFGVNEEKDVVIVCIGTDRSTGDCLGPLVGTKMTGCTNHGFTVYGTLDEPVHASNMNDRLTAIEATHPDAVIIAIDACLGHLENVGCVNIAAGSLAPGAGVNKNLPAVGQLNITGVVNVGGFMEYLVLQNTRLNLVMRLANLITEGLIQTAHILKTRESRCC